MPILADCKTNELITEREHEVLSGLLALLRDETRWVPSFLRTLKLYYAEHLTRGIPFTPATVIGEVISAYHDEPTNLNPLDAVLIATDQRDGGYEEIDASEFKELSNYLKVLRAGGWLAEHVSLEFDFFAEGRRYTPGEVIQHLTSFAFEGFQLNVDAAKVFLRDYPRLFEEDLKALNAAVTETQPQPAAPAAQPEAAAPQRKPRKRTSRKSAALAESK